MRISVTSPFPRHAGSLLYLACQPATARPRRALLGMADSIQGLILRNHSLLKAAEAARETRLRTTALAVEARMSSQHTRLESRHIRKLAEARRSAPVPLWSEYLSRTLSGD